MRVADLMIDARRLWPGESAWDGPLAFVDLDHPQAPEMLALPPCPVIGLGDGAHPLAAMLDAVIEAPVTAEAILRQVLAAPRAAAAIVELLRVLPALDVEAGLATESMAYAMLQGSAEHRLWLDGLTRPETAATSEGALELVRRDDRLIVTLASPQSGNAIDRAMRDALFDALSLAALDPGIVRISLRAVGRTFSFGADLAEFGTTTDPATAHAIRRRTLPALVAARCADRLDVHIQGGCVGSGLELAAWGARVTAAADAWFQLPELAMGILPGAGGCVSLTRRIGRQRTALMILSGKRLNARQALGLGLVDAIVDEPSGDNGGANVG
jgi:enoyl-CoA hydratase/carnithine racemase